MRFILKIISTLIILAASTISLTASDVFVSDITEYKSDNMIKVLSLDGGGLRGIITGKILQRLEELTERPISDSFDVIAGTSTGGMLALGLSVPGKDGKPKYTATEISKIYELNADRIFTPNWFSFGGLARPKYSSEGIEEVAHEYFGETRLSQSLTNTLITAYEIERDIPFLFKSMKAQYSSERDFLMKDVAKATGAAPTYFSPARINNLGNGEFTCIDGGVALNNPVISAALHGHLLFPNIDKMMVVSLGTGETTKACMYNDMKNAGSIKWINPLISTMMDGASTLADYQIKHLFGLDKQKLYYRLQPTIPVLNSRMDNNSLENMHMLPLLGEKAVCDFEEELQSIANTLKNTTRLTSRTLKLDNPEHR